MNEIDLWLLDTISFFKQSYESKVPVIQKNRTDKNMSGEKNKYMPNSVSNLTSFEVFKVFVIPKILPIFEFLKRLH